MTTFNKNHINIQSQIPISMTEFDFDLQQWKFFLFEMVWSNNYYIFACILTISKIGKILMLGKWWNEILHKSLYYHNSNRIDFQINCNDNKYTCEWVNKKSSSQVFYKSMSNFRLILDLNELFDGECVKMEWF